MTRGAVKTSERTRRAPQRTCVACGKTDAKRGFVRVVRTPDGVLPDPTGKLAGRGAYVCPEQACWDQAVRKGRLERSLRTALSTNDKENLLTFAAVKGQRREV